MTTTELRSAERRERGFDADALDTGGGRPPGRGRGSAQAAGA